MTKAEIKGLIEQVREEMNLMGNRVETAEQKTLLIQMKFAYEVHTGRLKSNSKKAEMEETLKHIMKVRKHTLNNWN
jgi:hypothetical protein